MSLLTSETVVKLPNHRNAGASRSIQPEIPGRSSIKPMVAPTTAPNRPSPPLKPAVAPKPVSPAEPAKSTTPWVYRGILVDPAFVRGPRTAQAARAESLASAVYRGIEVIQTFFASRRRQRKRHKPIRQPH